MLVRVVHLGGRENFAIPAMLERSGFNVDLVADLYRPFLFRLSGSRAGYHQLRHAKIKDFPGFSFKYSRALRKAKDKESVFEEYGSQFSTLAIHAFKDAPDVIISFSTTALEIFQAFKGRSLLVLDQIDGGPIEDQMVRDEAIQFPGWENTYSQSLSSMHLRMKKEWALADIIVVNSNFSKRCLCLAGVDANKIQVIPLCYEPKISKIKTYAKPGVFKVLFLGQVCLRKGIHYLDKAAEMISDKFPLKLTIAGPSQLTDEAIGGLAKKHSVMGKVKQGHIINLICEHDLLVLPSIAEGFGLVQLEALSCGVPVVATTNCGEAVDSSTNGYIIPPYDPHALAQAIVQAKEAQLKFDPIAALARFRMDAVAVQWTKVLKLK